MLLLTKIPLSLKKFKINSSRFFNTIINNSFHFSTNTNIKKCKLYVFFFIENSLLPIQVFQMIKLF